MSIITSIPKQAMVHSEHFNINGVVFDLEQRGINKPYKALWTSTWNDVVDEIPWIAWCKSENFTIRDHIRLYQIIPKRNLKILNIDTPEDYMSDDLIRIGSDETDDCIRPDFWNDDYEYSLYISYKEMKNRGFDGIHFSKNIISISHEFKMYETINGSYNPWVLNCMDCESSIWFNTNWIDKVIDTRLDVLNVRRM